MMSTYIDAMPRLPLLALLSAATVLASCGGDDDGDADNSDPSCAEDTRDEEYVAGISKTGENGYTVAIVDALPAPPEKGDNRWSVEVRDDSDTLVPGLLLEAAQFMPDHGHGSPVEAIMTDEGDGAYVLDPVNLFMPGYWETTVTIVDPGATDEADDDTDLDTVVFKFCLEG